MNVIGTRLSDIVSPNAVVVKTEKQDGPEGMQIVHEQLDVDGDAVMDAVRHTVKDADGKQLASWYSTETLISRTHAQDLFMDANNDGRIDRQMSIEGGVTSNGANGGAMFVTGWGDGNFDGMVDVYEFYDRGSLTVLEDIDYNGTYDNETRMTAPDEAHPEGTSKKRVVSIDVSTIG